MIIQGKDTSFKISLLFLGEIKTELFELINARKTSGYNNSAFTYIIVLISKINIKTYLPKDLIIFW